MLVYLFFSTISFTPNKEVEQKIPGKNQGRREKRQGLRIGQKAGSSARGTGTEGLKGQESEK